VSLLNLMNLKLRKLAPFLTAYREVYSSCVAVSETWPVKKENEMTLHLVEMIMIR